MIRSLLATTLVGAMLGLAPTAHAQDQAQAGITDVRLSRGTVAVANLNTVPVTIEADGGFTSADASTKLYAALRRESGSGNLDTIYSAAMTRYEGTPEQGKWRGTIYVPSPANGVFKLYSIGTGFDDRDELIEARPYDGPRITVKGTGQPTLTAEILPTVIPVGKPFRINWWVTGDGKPYGSKVKLALGKGADCARHRGQQVFTDTKGRFNPTFLPADAAGPVCLMVPGNPFPIVQQTLTFQRQPTATATAPATARAGSAVAVNGAVTGTGYTCRVELQRLYGATAWRLVAWGGTRASGRYTLTEPALPKGQGVYRVVFPECREFKAATSQTFRITGT